MVITVVFKEQFWVVISVDKKGKFRFVITVVKKRHPWVVISLVKKMQF